MKKSVYGKITLSFYQFIWIPILIIILPIVLKSQTNNYDKDKDSIFVAQYLEVINSGDRNTIRNFLSGNCDSTFLKRLPLEFHITHQLQYYYLSGGIGYEFKKIIETGDNAIKSLLRNKYTGAWIELNIPVNGNPLRKTKNFAEFKVIPAPKGFDKPVRKSDEEIIDQLEKCLSLMTNNEDFSGAVMFAKNGNALFKKAYGLADKSNRIQNRIDTKFNIASVGKIFTGVAVAQLVEKGKLFYDDTIDKYLPADWLNPEVGKKIQIKHLLTHTSGLGDYFSKLNKQCDKLLFRDLSDYQVLTSSETLSFEPGTKWSYSNTGLLLLGVIIEKVSGLEYFDYIQKNIFSPAGMINTGGFEKDRPVANRSLGYFKEYTNGNVNWMDNSISRVVKGSPSGGCFSTIEDLLNFTNALYAYKLLSKENTEIVLSAKPEINSSFYGYGFFISQSGIGKIAKHSGDGFGINAQYSVYLDAGYTVIVLSNYNRPAAEIIDNLLFQMLTM